MNENAGGSAPSTPEEDVQRDAAYLDLGLPHVYLPSLCTGCMKLVRRLDPIRCLPLNARVRFLRQGPDGMVAVADNGGRELPNLWHVSQLAAY